MLLANKRLPYGNQILARIMSLLKSILGKRKFLSTSMFRWHFLKKIFFFFCDDMELPYLYLTATNNKEFTCKISLTSFCAERSENKIRLKHHISRTDHNLLHFTALVIGQFSRTKNAGAMVSKRALDLGHFRFGQEVNMAEVVEVENAETQDCEFISEKMSEAQRKDLCKELEKHPCLWETCGPEYKNKPRRSRALDELCQKFNMSLNCLKKQLHSLRTALTREVQKETTEG